MNEQFKPDIKTMPEGATHFDPEIKFNPWVKQVGNVWYYYDHDFENWMIHHFSALELSRLRPISDYDLSKPLDKSEKACQVELDILSSWINAEVVYRYHEGSNASQDDPGESEGYEIHSVKSHVEGVAIDLTKIFDADEDLQNELIEKIQETEKDS